MTQVNAEALVAAITAIRSQFGFYISPKVLEAGLNAYFAQLPVSAQPVKKVALTPKQHELLTFLQQHSATNPGISPSFVEMRDALGLGSKSSIHRLVSGLEERGHIRRITGHARSIVLVEEPA